MAETAPKYINQKQLVRLFRDSVEQHQQGRDGIRFCFLLGAGASQASGIPTGYTLAKRWYAEIKEDSEATEFETWKTRRHIDEDNLAASYPQIFEQRFRQEPQIGFDELQTQMGKAEPSIGYLILAKVLAETRHSFVITTNFDHLVEDALFLATTTRPLVCGHESLAPYIQSQSQRPTIIKVHRDLLLAPFNQIEQVSKLDDNWVEALKPVLKHFRLVVIGYGGNDGSLMDYLERIPVEQRQKIFWCVRNPDSVNDKTRSALKETDTLVKIEGFEELMYELNDACKLEPFIDSDDIEKSLLIKNARLKAKHYKQKLNDLADKAKRTKPSSALKKLLPNWWEYEDRANQETNVDKRDAIYQEGIRVIPDTPELIGNYALFLTIQKNYEKAEEYYLRALSIDRTIINLALAYAHFLEKIHKNYDQAEIYYQEALELHPANVFAIGAYANFLKDIRKDYDQAEQYYLKALELDPDNANNVGNYASLLLSMGRIKEGATYMEKAFALQPSDGLLSELWFYKLAHFPEEVATARRELDTLLAAGVTSPGWDFSLNIERAEQDGCEYVAELKDYAAKISRLD